MTNLEKFIEVMNKTFNARFTPENMKLACSPCGALKKRSFACDHFKCDGCKRWWQKEYREEDMEMTRERLNEANDLVKMDELKPCPFCGGKVKICYGIDDTASMILCDNCGLVAQWTNIKISENNKTVVELAKPYIEAWNMRADDGQN